MEENHLYRVSVSWTNGREGRAEAAGVPEAIKFSAPPEFGGRGDLWSPEQLLVAAASTCFLSTLLYFAERKGLKLASYHCEAEGRLEMVIRKGLRFAEIVLRPVLAVEREEDAGLARDLLERSERACIVASSLVSPVRVEARVDVMVPALNG